RVVASDSESWPVGTLCQVNDWGLGETHWGGLSQLLAVPAEWISPVPEGRGAKWAASLGTAGFTAALCVMALLDHGLKVEDGPVLVTGVTGGVGSVATLLLSQMGFEVVGSTGSIDATGEAENDNVQRHLSKLGLSSSSLVHRDSLSRPGKPLQGTHYAAVVDSIGSHTLANALAQTRYGGIVAACGLAQGMDLDASVAPFILRSVTLRGINCVYRSAEDRARAWGLLADAFADRETDWMIQVIHLSEALGYSRDLLANQIQGRVVVNCV
ncbi:MAG: zinc-binding dehydrogenase, partial [Limnobacter sp.]|nr:zinc-binding dehydrogenase [Limnobacter sp.]